MVDMADGLLQGDDLAWTTRPRRHYRLPPRFPFACRIMATLVGFGKQSSVDRGCRDCIGSRPCLMRTAGPCTVVPRVRIAPLFAAIG
jgi:hypothetical protein